MKAYINKAAVVAEIDRLQEATMDKNQNFLSSYHEGTFDGLSMLENFLDTLDTKEVEEETVSNDLEEAACEYDNSHIDDNNLSFKAGAKWQKEQMIEKACNYLFSHMGLFVTFFDDDIVEDIERSEFIKKFRIAMEE